MTKAKSISNGKVKLRLEARKSLVNQLKPLVKTLQKVGLSKSSTEDIGVHVLFGIIKKYQDYFRVIDIIESFHAGSGSPKDIQKQEIMLNVYMDMWLKHPNRLPPKQSPFKDEVQAYIRKERITDKKGGEFISISEDSCFDFLRAMKRFISSSMPYLLKEKILDV